jgi:hypothetical protein
MVACNVTACGLHQVAAIVLRQRRHDANQTMICVEWSLAPPEAFQGTRFQVSPVRLMLSEPWLRFATQIGRGEPVRSATAGRAADRMPHVGWAVTLIHTSSRRASRTITKT